MCEWLSCGDWCDVRLICGGRSFNAHRAVLASVSSFLRRVLLSCPVDESPVFIFLPEFDIDAMSFVLYYIYNGEVLIPNHMLKMFLDTANAMEIFINQQNIPQSNEYHFESKSGDEIFAIQNYNIYQLTLCNGNIGSFINVRKGMRTDEMVRQMKEPVGTLNLYDNSIQTFRWSKENVPNFENVKSVSQYRQRPSFLRDTYINKYSQDGNVNGQTSDVLAISNEEYRTPTSVFFAHVNKNHLSASETFSDMSHTSLHQSSSKTLFFNYLKQLQDIGYKENMKDNINISFTTCNQFNNFNVDSMLGPNSKKEQDTDLWKTYTPLQISFPLLSRDTSSNFPLDRQSSLLNIDKTNVNSSLKSFPEILDKCEYDITSKCINTKSSHTVAKIIILNEVLQSPWHPRQPNCYRPFRKKVLNSMQSEKNHENKAIVSSKEINNNNVKQCKAKTNYKLVSTEQQNIKCTICHEVFTRRQDYSIHMKRHSSMPRYSCDECQKTFSQLRNFKYHMSVHRGTKEFAATCSVCGKHFNDRGYLSNHMKIHRNRKEYKCTSCPKSFNQRVAFNMHVRIHTGVKPHVCEECGKAFSRKMLLKQHQRTHSGERPYACGYCDKRFADRSNMTLHYRLHTGVKPFSCTLCPKSFTKKHHLKSHLNFHTGVKPYSCPRCNLAFTQSSNMRTHFKKCNATS